MRLDTAATGEMLANNQGWDLDQTKMTNLHCGSGIGGTGSPGQAWMFP